MLEPDDPQATATSAVGLLSDRVMAFRKQVIGGARAGGKGAEFSFEWPVLNAQTGASCLIVDDHPASRLILKTILTSQNILADEASNIASAQVLLHAQAPCWRP